MMDNPESVQEVVEHKVRRAIGVNALCKIGKIVVEEQQADEEKAQVLRWLSCWRGRIVWG